MKDTPLTLGAFQSEAELLDDLNDHWTASHHKKERNQLIDVSLGNGPSLKAVADTLVAA